MTRYRLRLNEREVDLGEGNFVVGRARDCQLKLPGGLVSRRHARFVVGPESLTLEDLGSRNGVLVNATRITKPTRLTHGDVVSIGIASLEVVDRMVVEHPEHLSTLPPNAAPWCQSDVDAPEQDTVAARIDMLTERETEVLKLLVLGHTQREIAERIHLSVKTIETHRAHLAEKTGCRTRAELVAYAISAGMLRTL